MDFEHGLNSSVKSLRAVLGDSVQEPRYIETIPKIGYRFIAEVERSGDDSGAHVAQGAESPLEASAVTSGPTAPNAVSDSAPSRRFAVMALSVSQFFASCSVRFGGGKLASPRCPIRRAP